jgi:hypothetical protein
MKFWRNASRLVLSAALVAAAAGCTSDSPSEPSNPPVTPKPPAPVVSFNISVTASPSQLNAGGQDSSTVTVRVTRADNGAPAPNLTPVVLTTTLGSFTSPSGPQTLQLELVNGEAQAVLFAGSAVGTATIRAQVGSNAAATNVQIGQPGTFFLASVAPAVGSPQGGDTVNITGGGFDPPVRVTFNGTPAVVQSVTPDRIRVITPSATAAGVDVGVGESVPVSVSVTINVNEPNQASDTLQRGFTYSRGGSVQQPQVFSVTPASGTNDGGTRVTIVGEGFEAPIQVLFGEGTVDSFNGVEATVESVTSNRIIVITPAARGFGQNNVNQIVDILIKNLNTGFAIVANEEFKYGSNVLITAMGPTVGPYTGGTRVTLSGQGFDEPVAVTLGGIGQQVISVTGTQILFITSGVLVTECPTNGIVEAEGVSVVNIETGDGDDASLGFQYVVPRPVIFGVSPTTGNTGSPVSINGQGFAPNVQVIFGPPGNGSTAAITSSSGNSINATVPVAPPGFSFNTRPCDGDGDGNPGGTLAVPTPLSITVRNLDGTGCEATLTNVFALNPPSPVCTGDTTASDGVGGGGGTPECSDGIDNDLDGFIDLADPQCVNGDDTSESI